MKPISTAGFLVPVFFAFGYWGVPKLTHLFFHSARYQNFFPYIVYPSILVNGMILWWLGRYLNTRIIRTYIDTRTGKEKAIYPYHHFIFLQIQYWAILMLVGIAAFETWPSAKSWLIRWIL